jgi:hypothetical protein
MLATCGQAYSCSFVLEIECYRLAAPIYIDYVSHNMLHSSRAHSSLFSGRFSFHFLQMTFYGTAARPPVARVQSNIAADFTVDCYSHVGGTYFCPRDAERRAASEYIRSQRRVSARGGTTWRVILKSHFTRTKKMGGPVNTSPDDPQSALNVQDAFEIFPVPGHKNITLRFNNSYRPGDGIACGSFVVAKDMQESAEALIERASELLVMTLLLCDTEHAASAMVLKAANWKVSLDELVTQIARYANSAVPLENRTAIVQEVHSRAPAYVPPTHKAEREREVLQLLHDMANAHQSDEWVKLYHCRRLWRGGAIIRAFEELSRLCEPKSLLPFLQQHGNQFDLHFDAAGKFRGEFRLKQGPPVARANTETGHEPREQRLGRSDGPPVASQTDADSDIAIQDIGGTQEMNPGKWATTVAQNQTVSSPRPAPSKNTLLAPPPPPLGAMPKRAPPARQTPSEKPQMQDASASILSLTSADDENFASLEERARYSKEKVMQSSMVRRPSDVSQSQNNARISPRAGEQNETASVATYGPPGLEPPVAPLQDGINNVRPELGDDRNLDSRRPWRQDHPQQLQSAPQPTPNTQRDGSDGQDWRSWGAWDSWWDSSWQWRDDRWRN